MPGFLKVAAPVVLFLGLTLVSLNLARVTKIDLANDSCIAEDELGLKGKLIFTIDEKQLENDLKEKFACVASAKIKKVYPQKVKVEIQVETPVAKIALTQLAITAGGLVLEASRENLPLLHLPANVAVSPGQKMTDEISLYTAKLAALLAKSDFHTANIRIVSPDIAVYDTSETVAIFSSSQLARTQVDSLQLVLSKAKMGEQKIKKIDLRFEKPVVTFK